MSEHLSIKRTDFWRLLKRESFLSESFQANLRYRIPSTDNDEFYIEVTCPEPTLQQYAEKYIRAYLEPKYTRSLELSLLNKANSVDEQLLNRLMREYVLHISISQENEKISLNFHSLDLTVLYLAIDNFAETMESKNNDEPKVVAAAQSLLRSLSKTVEGEWRSYEESDQVDQEVTKNVTSAEKTSPRSKFDGPALKVAHPKASSQAHDVSLEQFIDDKGKKKNKHKHKPKNPGVSPTDSTNDLVREIRQKLKGRELRDVIIDGANVGRTYGEKEFSAKGIKLAVDLFKAYGYPDSKIVVITPTHYLSKDKDGIFTDLLQRKILHGAFHQVIDQKARRFYDDRLIVDLAVIRQGVILSNDFYRDLMKDSGEAAKKAIRERSLCYRFIADDLCLPNPVSEGGASLDRFLSK